MIKKATVAALTAVMIFAPIVNVKASSSDVIDTSKTGSITIHKYDMTAAKQEGTEKVDYTVYIWYNVSIKYRRCFYDRTTAEIDAKSIHGNI